MHRSYGRRTTWLYTLLPAKGRDFDRGKSSHFDLGQLDASNSPSSRGDHTPIDLGGDMARQGSLLGLFSRNERVERKETWESADIPIPLVDWEIFFTNQLFSVSYLENLLFALFRTHPPRIDSFSHRNFFRTERTFCFLFFSTPTFWIIWGSSLSQWIFAERGQKKVETDRQ